MGMQADSKIYVAGHNGLVGSAIVRALHEHGYRNLVFASHKELDLCEQDDVRRFFKAQRPEYVFLAAARVGGIGANSSYPADFIRDNLLIETHVIDSAWRNGCKKLLFLGSSCIYPRQAKQPISEDELLSGYLESTNDCYALAKISGIRMSQAYRQQFGFDTISLMPTNLYGPHDNFHAMNSHVVPGLMRRFHEARQLGLPEVVIWGSGNPLRELMHVDDLADCCVFLMNNYSDASHINVGSDEEVSIMQLARMLAQVTGYTGKIVNDISKPDGTPRKKLDCSRLKKLGWKPRINLADGLLATYRWYTANLDEVRQ